MTSVGIREFRQRASELLRKVENGETIEITDRGRPVALLSPLPQGSLLERLRKVGEVETATGEIDDLPEPRAARGAGLPSQRLEQLRAAER